MKLQHYNTPFKFATEHDADSGALENWFGAVKLSQFDSACLLVGQFGGSLWDAFDITANIDSTTQVIESAAQAMFSWLGVDAIYIKESKI